MKTLTLGEACEIVSGATPKSGVADYWGGGIAWATPADLSALDGPYISGTPRTLTAAGLASCSARVLPAGSVLLSSRAPIGHVAINTIPMATNQGFKSLVPRSDVLDGQYLFHWLRSRTPFLQSLGNGATFKELSRSTVERIEIPVPPLTEQRRIVAILNHADFVADLRARSVLITEQVAGAVFGRTFGQPMGRTGPWPKLKLGDLARIIRGASPRPAGDPTYFGGAIPWLKISDVTATPGRIVEEIRHGVTEAGRDRSVLLPPRTLILTNSATVGIAKVVKPATCIHDGFLAFLDLDDRVDQTWLWAALRASRERLVALAPEGTQKNLNGPIVKAVEVSLPPIGMQRTFAHELRMIETAMATRVRALDELRSLRAGLQSQAFSGQL